MSIAQIKVIILNPNFTASENGVLVGLAFTAKNDRPTGWPGIPTIGGYSGLSHNTIRITLNSLIKCRCLTRELRPGTTDLFTLNMTEIETHHPLPNLVPLKTGTPTKSVTTPPTKPGTPPLPDLSLHQGKGNVIETEEETETLSAGVRKPHTNGHRPEWVSPEWFKPLTRLDGYTRRNHAKAAKTIEASCNRAEVDPAGMVAMFADYWEEGKVAHGWGDPIASLNRTRNVQISKFRESEHEGVSRARRSEGQAPGKPLSEEERGQQLADSWNTQPYREGR